MARPETPWCVSVVAILTGTGRLSRPILRADSKSVLFQKQVIFIFSMVRQADEAENTRTVRDLPADASPISRTKNRSETGGKQVDIRCAKRLAACFSHLISTGPFQVGPAANPMLSNS
jgi:hypothetical protein